MIRFGRSVPMACALVSAALPLTAAAPPEPVTVGVIISVSGPFAPLGEPVRNAIAMAADDVNAHGGVNGRPLRVEIVDDGGSPETAAQLATGFSDRKIPIVIGGSVTPPTTGIARVAGDGKFVQIYLTSTAGIWQTKNGVARNIFEIAPRNEYEVQALLPYAVKNLATKKLAIIHDENVYGVSGEAAIKAEAAKDALEIVADEGYPSNATDATAQILKIKQSGADTVYLWGASPATGIIVAQARQLGMTAHILAGGGILTDAFLKVAGRGADGLYTMSQSNFTHPNAREFAFINAYHARYDARPTNFAVNGWNAVHVVRAALAAVPDGDTTKLAAWLERMPAFLGTMPIRFTPTDHDGGKTLVPAVAKNGVWYTL